MSTLIQTTVPNQASKTVCYTCGSKTHTSRNCDEEKNLAHFFKQDIGHTFEHVVSQYIDCPMCKESNSFQVLGDNTPSLDLICNKCKRPFEVKSKAFTKNNDNNITLPHGCWESFKERRDSGLHLIIVLYGIDRQKKNLYVTNVYHASNSMLKDKNERVISVYPLYNSSLCEIYIKNKIDLKKLVPKVPIEWSFKEQYEEYKKYLIANY